MNNQAETTVHPIILEVWRQLAEFCDLAEAAARGAELRARRAAWVEAYGSPTLRELAQRYTYAPFIDVK